MQANDTYETTLYHENLRDIETKCVAKVAVAFSNFSQTVKDRINSEAETELDTIVTQVTKEFKSKVLAAWDDSTNMNSAVANLSLKYDKKLESSNASLCEADQTIENTLSDGIETVLKENVALYQCIDDAWVPLDTKTSRSIFHLYRCGVDRTYSFVICQAGRVRAEGSIKCTRFIKRDKSTICFAVPVYTERKTQASNEKTFIQFAVKINAERVDGLMSTLYNATEANGILVKQDSADLENDDAIPIKNKTFDEVVEQVTARLFIWIGGEFKRRSWKKDTVAIYYDEQSGFRLVCKRSKVSVVVGKCHRCAFKSVKKVGRYIEIKTVDKKRAVLKLNDLKAAERLAHALNGFIESSYTNMPLESFGYNHHDSSLEPSEVNMILYQIRARPVLVTPNVLDVEDRFFFIPADAYAPDLYTKQLDEGWLQIGRKSSGGYRLDLLSLSWDISEGTKVAVQDYVINFGEPSSYTLTLIKILCKEYVTGEVYMLQVRKDKVLELYNELRMIGLVDIE